MADFRALCAELAGCLQGRKDLECGWPGEDPEQDLLDRARAMLDQPVGCNYPSCVEDSEDERCSRWLTGECQGPDSGARTEPEGPTDEEILALSQGHEVSYTLSDGSVVYPMQEGSDMKDAVLSFTRAVLARWGCPAIEAVPVSERLPGPEDCDEEGCCWWWRTDGVEEHWELTSLGDPIRHNESCAPHVSYTHWLPYTAIPTPTREENLND